MAVKQMGNPLSLGNAAGGAGNDSNRNIVGEFGGTTPHSMSEYYAGAPSGFVPPGTGNIPTSGVAINFSVFYGTQSTVYFSISGGSVTTNTSGDFKIARFSGSGGFNFTAGTEPVEYMTLGGGGAGNSGGNCGRGQAGNGQPGSAGSVNASNVTVGSPGSGNYSAGGAATASTLSFSGATSNGAGGNTGGGGGNVSGIPGNFSPVIPSGTVGDVGPAPPNPSSGGANNGRPGQAGNIYGGGGGGGGGARCSTRNNPGGGGGAGGAGREGTVAIRYKFQN